MILRFGCENYKSIGEYQEILFTAVGTRDEGGYLLIPSTTKEKVLPITAVYGANGSGKTNLLSALKLLVAGIRVSATRGFAESSITKFRLDEMFGEEPSSFDIDFIFQDVHYHYGYSIHNDEVISEWLYSFSYKNRKSRKVLFHRDSLDTESEFYFGAGLKGKNKSISEITDKASLFISVAAKSKHVQLKKIWDYFKDNYKFRFYDELSENNVGSKINKYGVGKKVSEFLSLIDIGASKVEVTEVEIDKDRIEFRDSLMGLLKKSAGDEEFAITFPKTEFNINIIRELENGNKHSFRYDEESSGTTALISLLPSIFNVLSKGGVYVVDELESSLHTLLALKVLDLFKSPTTNPNNAQLIFTTHEIQLLNYEGIRRDEIWLTEKARNGSTHIAPLSDYSIDKRSNLINGYLAGRFGAIPLLGDLNRLNVFLEEK